MAVALLALLVVIAFANVIFAGRSLVPSENINPLDHRENERSRGPGFISHEEWQRRNLVSYPNYRDVAAATLQFEPSQEFLRRSLQRGEFPFWDPFTGGGSPSFASLVPAYLFPPGLMVVLLGNSSLLRNIYILLLIFCAGTSTYILLRRHGLRWQSSLAGGIAFAFSGAVIQTAPTGLGQPVAFFALPLIFTCRLIEAPSGRRAAQMALVFAFVAFATFPPILMQAFGLCVVYLATHVLVNRKRTGLVAAGWFTGGALMSLAVVGVAYAPAIRLLREASHVSAYYRHAARDILEPRQIAQLLSPTIMGGSSIYSDSPLVGTTSLHLYYVGIVVVVLTILSLFAGVVDRAKSLQVAAGASGLLALAKIFGIPPIHWISEVPLLRNIHYAAYFGILVSFVMALFVAMGIDALIRHQVTRKHVVITAAATFLLLTFLRYFAWRAGVGLHPQGWRWIADFRVLVIFSIAAVLLCWIARRASKFATVAVLLLLATLATEGITNTVYPRPRRWNVWQNPPQHIEMLGSEGTGGRILPMPIYPANTQSVFRQPTIDTILFSSTRMNSLYKRYFNRAASMFLRETRQIPPERILDLANIEYIAIGAGNSGASAEAAARGYDVLLSNDLVHLVRRNATPRYTFVSDYRVSTHEAEALESLAGLPEQIVLLENSPSFAPASLTSQVTPRMTEFQLNSVELEVDAPQHGMLVCSESNMPGWTATVDGRPTDIVAANYAFRAVEVPPGRHTIRFHYWPPGLTEGIFASIAGVTACLWLLLRREGLHEQGP